MPRQDISFPEKDAELREDVHMLGVLVGEVIREQAGEEVFSAVESDRQAAIAHREGSTARGIELRIGTRGLAAEKAHDVLRAFSTWFDMVNMAEKVHRIRRRRHYLNNPDVAQPGGIEDAIAKLQEQGVTLPQMRHLMLELWIEPVFTAHPTESTRRTILRKQQKIAQLLFQRLGLSRSSAETRVLWERIRTEITSGWQTADNSRERLSVADEREHVLFFIAEVLYQIVPIFYEEIEAALAKIYGPEATNFELPEILRFGSWVGGDMDGNPDVHAKTIRETVARQQQLIVNRYFLECQALAEALSQSATRIGITPELQSRMDVYSIQLSSAQSLTPARHDRMPYRVFLGQVMERLRATYEGRQNHYEGAAQFLDDVQLIARSLLANKGEHAGYFSVRRLIRRVRTFGFHLATLDIRQNASVHRAVIGQGFDDAQWTQRTSDERVARLRQALAKDEGPVATLDATGKRSLWVMEALAHCRHRYGADAIGPYVVSSTRGPDDLLSVLLLARWAETGDRRSGDVPVDVAPLFESSAALERAGTVIKQLFSEPEYQRHLIGRGNHQYVMIGYSASNKECGILRARWLVRLAQEGIFSAANAANVDITLIHGQGGSNTRGGGRTEILVGNSPQDARRGRLRITEQGELLSERYGLRPIALRVFEQAFGALALSRGGAMPPERVEPHWREIMQELSDRGSEAYRTTVLEDPEFFEFFRQVTPVDVIERMQIGSRPATRDERGGVATFRSIPWNHAWSQCRYMLPGWFGAGTALEQAAKSGKTPALQEMYRSWFFFSSLIDDVELALGRADMQIAAFYDELVDPKLRRFTELLRAEFELARKHVLALTGCGELLANSPTVQRSIKLRTPYIDPMHLVQVDLLKRWRAAGREDRQMFAALLASVGGISRGLQGT